MNDPNYSPQRLVLIVLIRTISSEFYKTTLRVPHQTLTYRLAIAATSPPSGPDSSTKPHLA